MPSVSVIVPIYNTQELLPRCVDSVLNQTCRDMELILVDDGSTDNTPGLCDEYANADNRVKALHKKNNGSEKARESGLQMADGEFVLFLDADDYLALTTIEHVLHKAREWEAEIVCFDFECNGKKGFGIAEEKLFDVNQALNSMLLCKELDGNMWGKLFKTQLLKQANVKFQKKRNCDFLTCAQIIGNASKVLIIPEVGYYYSYITGSQSRNIHCHPKEEEYEAESYRFLQKMRSEKPDIVMAAEYNWLKALLYVNTKLEKDKSIRRNSERMKYEKNRLRGQKKTYLKNPYLQLRDKLQYFLCYFNLFRSAYSVLFIIKRIW